MYFDILNRLGADHKCSGQTADGQADRQTAWPLAVACCDI